VDVRSEILAFDPEIPISKASTPPASWYVDPAFEPLERQAVFRRTWQVACRAEEVAAPGSFVAGRLAGLSYVVVRGEDGVLRALANTCRHKATEVCSGSGTAAHFTCPYHGWTYRLDGSLRTAPRMAGVEDFDRASMALPALAVEEFGPLVLICADRDVEPLRPRLEPLHQALEATGWRQLRWHSRRVYEVGCNWKAYCDNYLDGGYHVAHMHPGLAAQLDLDSYRTEVHDTWSLQTCRPSEAQAARTEGGALYVWLYPNLMVNRYGPCLDTNVVIPLSARRCQVIFDFWFDPAQRDAQWAAASADDSERTQREDMDVSERVQSGMETGTWARGRYAPRVEAGIHHFHRLLAADLRGALQRGWR
jgi:choline monooxygenase